jgi:hypothetical protein
VAVWFLLHDLVSGELLRTPAILAAVLLQGIPDPAGVSAAAGPILGYTALHALAFVLVGLGGAWLLERADREPAMLLPLLAFFLAFEVFFLAVIVFLAQPVLGLVTWWAILVANLLASVSMLAWFLVGHRGLADALVGSWISVGRQGVVAGVLGGAVIAVWFLAYDTLRFQDPFRTPALLGAAVFEGLRDPGALTIGLFTVLGYTALHFAAFGLFGIVAAALLWAAGREPRLLLLLFVLFWGFEVFFLGVLSLLDAALVGVLVWWNIALANLSAAIVMLAYFFVGHGPLGARLITRWAGE